MFETFFVLFGLMGLGFIALKLHWIDEVQNQGLGTVLMNIAFPGLMFASIIKIDMQGTVLKGFIESLLLSLFFFLLYAFLGVIYTKIAKTPRELDGMVILSMLTSNNAFIGFPLAVTFFCQTGFMYMVANNLAMSIVVFSLGVSILKRSRAHIENNKTTERASIITMLKQVSNPIIISILVAIFVNLIGLGKYVPSAFLSLASILGDLATPLSMLYIGATLATSPLKDLFYNKLVLGVSITRLTVFVAITYLLLTLLPLSPLMKQILFLVSALPSAAIVAEVTEKYGVGYRESVNIIVVSTIFSLITTPLGVYIALTYF